MGAKNGAQREMGGVLSAHSCASDNSIVVNGGGGDGRAHARVKFDMIAARKMRRECNRAECRNFWRSD